MIKLFEEFRWMRRRNSKHKDVDPYNEEYWENDDDIYCDYDLKTYGLEEEANKSTELIVKNKRVLFRDLRERMNSNNYDKPYFTGLIDNIALFEVISLED